MANSVNSTSCSAPCDNIPTAELQRGDRILSMGTNGLVVCRYQVVVKITIRKAENPERERSSFKNEIAAYERLRGCQGVVPYHGISWNKNGISLRLMSNGSISDYLKFDPPPKSLHRRWFLQMATGLAEIHDKCIIHNNVTTENLLLDSTLNVHFCGFSNSVLLAPGTFMEIAEGDGGCSIYTDMAQLGNIIYDMEVEGEGLRPFTHLYLGEVIGKCWAAGYSNAGLLCSDLREFLDEDG